MRHIYTVYPPDCQPQWPVNDNKPQPSLAHKMLMGFAVACLILMLPAAIALGLLSMTVMP